MSKPTLRERLDALDKEEELFKRALGQFMLTWTDAEAALYGVLKHYARVSDAVARAIFSGTRAKTMIDFIRGIAHNTDLAAIEPKRNSDLEFVFDQIAAINTVRDRVVHFASDSLLEWNEPSARIISNVSRVSRYNKHFIEEVGSATLDRMTYDLQAIRHHLDRHTSRYSTDFSPWEENEGEPTTWRYKPRQPGLPSASSGAIPPKRPRQQKPSPKK